MDHMSSEDVDMDLDGDDPAGDDLGGDDILCEAGTCRPFWRYDCASRSKPILT